MQRPPLSPPDPLPTDLQELGISLWNGAASLLLPALRMEEAAVAPPSVAALGTEQGAAPSPEELLLLTWGSKPQWPAGSMLRWGLGYLKHAWRDNAHFMVWSFPPQPWMPETLIKSIKLSICCWDLTTHPGWAWPQVRAAGLQKRGKEPDEPDRWSNQCPNTMATRTNSYLSGFIHFLSSLLPGSMCILLWGCNSLPPGMLGKLFCPRAQKSAQDFVWLCFLL